MVLISLFSTLADLGMEAPQIVLPLTQSKYILCVFSSYTYLVLRNATNVVLLLFVLHLTQTSFLINARWAKVVFSMPYLCILAMLIMNPFNHLAFTITMAEGYTRGPLMTMFYIIALVYGLVGSIYSFHCHRYLPVNKWIALLTIYILGYVAVIIQFFYPEILVEMFCTAVGEMMIMVMIMRPEERMDLDVGVLSWASYQSDLKNILLSGEQVRIIAIEIRNSKEIRNYLGDHEYNSFVSQIASSIRTIHYNRRRIELYFEKPGTFYLITNGDDEDVSNITKLLMSETGKKIGYNTEKGVRFEPSICVIRTPEDLNKIDDIITLGHKFSKIAKSDKDIYYSEEIVHSQNFAIEAHIEEIIERAIKDRHIEMYYQPIYDVHTRSFHSAEALARINDPEYGLISPGVFIPAAESSGLIIPLGDVIMDQVFSFIASNDMNDLGLSCIELNLSVAQCMEKNLPDKFRELQNRYDINPGYINLEITETVFENISEVMLQNVRELVEMGYGFALDDYGIGYSSIQRVNHLPLNIIKIDKSMLDEVKYDNGRKILEYTVRMMQNIGKKLVIEGAETEEVVEILKNMNCDYIQGFYFSKPVPSEEFISFIEDHK